MRTTCKHCGTKFNPCWQKASFHNTMGYCSSTCIHSDLDRAGFEEDFDYWCRHSDSDRVFKIDKEEAWEDYAQEQYDSKYKEV